ncbi:hypothetical protein [Streptomyces bacillaris]|uniref:hypothetical protein n=1 Tax=Streptomyces bacillaris TaxID=68179 RepID=UPI00345FB833
MSDDESTIKAWLRARIDGPALPEAEPEPLVQVRYVPPATTPATDPDDEDDGQDDPYEEEGEPEERRPWWHLAPGPFGTPRRTSEPPAPAETEMAPGLYVTVHQPQPTAPQWTAPDPAAEAAAERLHRRRVWFAYHAAAAAVGWVTGLVGLMRGFLAEAGPAAPGVGIAMGFVAWIVASYLPGLPYMPPALRPVMVWAARIPVCSAALALALYAPGAV